MSTRSAVIVGNLEYFNGKVCLLQLLADLGGFYFPDWYAAGKVYIEREGAVPFGTLWGYCHCPI